MVLIYSQLRTYAAETRDYFKITYTDNAIVNIAKSDCPYY